MLVAIVRMRISAHRPNTTGKVNRVSVPGVLVVGMQ